MSGSYLPEVLISPSIVDGLKSDKKMHLNSRKKIHMTHWGCPYGDVLNLGLCQSAEMRAPNQLKHNILNRAIGINGRLQ